MQRVILDTDVASLSIKNRLPPHMLRALLGTEAGITFVTLGELTRWATIRQWGTNRRAELESWLTAHPTLPYDDEIARTWGDISAHASRRPSPPPATILHQPTSQVDRSHAARHHLVSRLVSRDRCNRSV